MDYFFLSSTKLFQGLNPEEIEGMMGCLGFYEKRYPKDTVIFHAGDTITELGLVMAGSVNIIVNTYWGTTSILGHVGKGEIFGEAYAAIPGKELLCEVVACEDCRVLFLPMSKALTQCGNGCGFHNRLIHNLIRISAGKNLNLSNRMMHITPRTIRERLLSYLSEQMMEHGNVQFAIPFSRQQLADYLCVDRSALSNELSKLQLGTIENRYSGIPTIRYAMKKMALLEPLFIDSRGTFKVVLYHKNTDAVVQNSPTPNNPLTDLQDEKGLLEFCHIPRSRAEIIEYLEIASGQYALRRYLDPLVEAKAILLTLPDTPRSPKQRYLTAEK